MKIFFATLLFLFTPPAQAEQRTSWDGTLYGYASTTTLQANSVLNPGNQAARIPQRTSVAEARFNFKAENDTLRFFLRPIILTEDARNTFGSQQHNEAYLSQWQLRVRTAEAWSVTAGREVLNWGPAQFRSPSSPFYFNNGRSNPMSELSGVDALKVVFTPDVNNAAYIAHLSGSGHIQNDPWRDTWLVKADHRGGDWAGGVVLAKIPDQITFVGAHIQQTLTDALLLYGEAGSSTRTDALLGAAYTLENGQSLAAEYLHHGYGYTASETTAYFSGAVHAAPALLGRDYLHLLWQSNSMSGDNYWRLMWTRNLTDDSQQVAGYGEFKLDKRWTGYALAMLSAGGARREFASLNSP